MKKNRIIISILFLCMMLINLSGCSNQSNSNEDIKEKVIQELDYLDTRTISILNKLNNITLQNYNVTSEEVDLEESSSSSRESKSGGEGGSSQNAGINQDEDKQSTSQEEQSSKSEEKSNITTTQMEPKTILETNENDVDWKTIKNEIERINDSWPVILLDLSTLNVDRNDILDFSATLDNCILSIKDENKIDSLNNLAKLFSFIPKFEVSISAHNSIQNIKQVKSYLISSYSLVEQDKWSDIENNMLECEKTYKNIINDIEFIRDKEFKINRAYVLIKELQNSLSYKDKKLFYLKYKNLIETINTF